jgi:NAD(P)H-dependent flavin oxidoreductase YrpB (nitropropane dioxygenase family)
MCKAGHLVAAKITERAKAVTTPVCEMLGIEQPIVQAPMAAIPRLAATVSNAGALGMVTLTWSADVGAVVRETAALTARPFGGNLVLTEDQHHRLDQALEAGLRIVSFYVGGSQRLHQACARRRGGCHAHGRQCRGGTAGGRVRRRSPPLAQRPGEGDVIAHFASGESIVRYEPAPPMAGTTGDIEALSMWAGQGVALARQPQSAADIVTELTSRL